jgi:hypothetical protein
MWSFLMTQSSCSLVVLVAVLMKLVCACMHVLCGLRP